MKAYKSKTAKTEGSLEKSQDNSVGRTKNFNFHSSAKAKKKFATPLRFADVISKKNIQQKSTADNNRSKQSGSNQSNKMKESISEAINILKETSAESQNSQKSNDSYNHNFKNKEISPFLITAEQIFEEQVSFKGANNRLALLKKIQDIEIKSNNIFQRVKNLNHNSGIDFITFKLLKSKEENLKLSYYQFYSHLQSIAKKVSNFVIELNRCRNIMSTITTGITKKTMNFYVEKFEGLIEEFIMNTNHLESYVNLLNDIQKKQKRAMKKYILAPKGSTYALKNVL